MHGFQKTCVFHVFPFFYVGFILFSFCVHVFVLCWGGGAFLATLVFLDSLVFLASMSVSLRDAWFSERFLFSFCVLSIVFTLIFLFCF